MTSLQFKVALVIGFASLLAIVCSCPSCGYIRVTTITDTSPKNLDMHLDYSVPSHGNISVILSLWFDGAIVDLKKGETAECNGHAISFNSGNYDFETSLPANTTNLACSYSSSGKTGNVVVPTIVTLPVFLSPQDGEQIPRSNNFSVIYQAGNGTDMGMTIAGYFSQDARDTGAFRNIDTRYFGNFPVGSGTPTPTPMRSLNTAIFLTRNYHSSPSSSDFHALDISGSATTTIWVTFTAS